MDVRCCLPAVPFQLAIVLITDDVPAQGIPEVAIGKVLHDKHGVHGLEAGPQKHDDVGVPQDPQAGNLLDKARLLHLRSAVHHLDGHRPETQSPLVDLHDEADVCLDVLDSLMPVLFVTLMAVCAAQGLHCRST